MPIPPTLLNDDYYKGCLSKCQSLFAISHFFAHVFCTRFCAHFYYGSHPHSQKLHLCPILPLMPGADISSGSVLPGISPCRPRPGNCCRSSGLCRPWNPTLRLRNRNSSFSGSCPSGRIRRRASCSFRSWRFMIVSTRRSQRRIDKDLRTVIVSGQHLVRLTSHNDAGFPDPRSPR